jgi:syntaxin-binding protein 1
MLTIPRLVLPSLASSRPRHGGWAQGRAAKREVQSRALPSAAASGGRGDKKSYRPRLIVFIMGSMSYNEMRCAYEVSRALDWDVYIGSHAIKAPADFIKELEVLDKPVADCTCGSLLLFLPVSL